MLVASNITCKVVVEMIGSVRLPAWPPLDTARVFPFFNGFLRYFFAHRTGMEPKYFFIVKIVGCSGGSNCLYGKRQDGHPLPALKVPDGRGPSI